MYAEISQIVPSDIICDALRELVPFAQFKKREKHLEDYIAQRQIVFF